jgi:hypothetical protein
MHALMVKQYIIAEETMFYSLHSRLHSLEVGHHL